KYGVISARANVMIPIIYDKITSMGGGVFAGLWEIETNKGKGIYQIGKGELVPAIYSEIDFSSILDSEFIVKADNKYGVYNFKGNLVHPIEYDLIKNKGGLLKLTKNEQDFYLINNQLQKINIL